MTHLRVISGHLPNLFLKAMGPLLLLPYLSHVDKANCQSLVAQNGPVFIPLPSLQHDLQLVGVSLQEVGILQKEPPKRKWNAKKH